MKRLYTAAWAILFHTLAILTTAAVISLPAVGWTQVELFWQSYMHAGFEPDGVKIALHLGLAACLWALVVIAFQLARARSKEEREVTRLVQKGRGTVLTETLIVIVPFLLLTSGLAQLAMLNVTGLLADLAVFQAARAVFVWSPEVTQDRYESSNKYTHIKDRARTIAAMSLAPTAPNDYYIGRSVKPGSSNYFRRQRAYVTGAFMPDGSSPQANYDFSGGQDAFTTGAFSLDASHPIGDKVSYVAGFDTKDFRFRAARKMTQAEWGLYHRFSTICPQHCDITRSDEAGVHFNYWYNIVFPWFGYIWGEWESVGVRTGWYSKIERRHTFPVQPMP